MQRLTAAHAEQRDKATRAQQRFLDAVLTPHARQIAAELREDLGLRGEAYVAVGWDDAAQAPTAERIDPATIVPSLAYPPPPSAREPWRP